MNPKWTSVGGALNTGTTEIFQLGRKRAKVIADAHNAEVAKLREQLAEFAAVALKNGQGLVSLEIENIKLREELEQIKEMANLQ